jgi:hypothetical protein
MLFCSIHVLFEVLPITMFLADIHPTRRPSADGGQPNDIASSPQEKIHKNGVVSSAVNEGNIIGSASLRSTPHQARPPSLSVQLSFSARSDPDHDDDDFRKASIFEGGSSLLRLSHETSWLRSGLTHLIPPQFFLCLPRSTVLGSPLQCVTDWSITADSYR